MNGTEYPGLQFYFIMFPYKPGNYTIPPIKIVATTPPVGESEAQKATIQTTAQKFVVKAVPASFTGDWFVAKDVSVSQSWNRPLSRLKVGDVIERTVVENAKGTLPQFIPELKPDSLSWAGIYPQDAKLQDTRDDYDANGIRTQTFTYLLEKEGDYVLPAATVQWWNPYSRRVFKRSTGNTTIHVAANPDLGILATLKDSLSAKQPVAVVKEKSKGPYLIYGIPWYWFALYSLAAILALFAVTPACIRIYRSIHQRFLHYRNSEVYWFRKFERSPLQFPRLLKHLYAWWDRWQAPGKSVSILQDAKNKNEDAVANELSVLYKEVFEKDNTVAKANEDFKKNIRQYRKETYQTGGSMNDDKIDMHQKPWR